MTVQFTANTGLAPVQGMPPAKVMSPWSGGPGIANFSGVAPLMTVQLTAITVAALAILLFYQTARGFILLKHTLL